MKGYPYKLSPSYMEYIWGGTRLKTSYNKNDAPDVTAESWELSCHGDAPSHIESGEFAGKTLSWVLENHPEWCGTATEKFDRFPVLIKLIDAARALSIQVHPGDEYALKKENDLGKTEMWYVLESAPGAFIYYGFSIALTKDEFKRRIEDNTIEQCLNKVYVKKGDCIFIKSGTLHAIGEGLLIAEIQQNSNTTYRVYDYGRLGNDGKPRQLHIEKALDVTDTQPCGEKIHNINAREHAGVPVKLASCEYFRSDLVYIDKKFGINADEKSFRCLLCIEGEISIDGVDFKKGESVFIPAGYGKTEIFGKGEAIITYIESKN